MHYDRWWNPAVEDQATDRAYRIGQDRPVQVHRLVTENTLEDRIATVIAAKRDLADAVVGSGEAWLSELSDTELTELVELSTATGSSPERRVRTTLLLLGEPPAVADERAGARGRGGGERSGENAGLPAARGPGSRRPFGATWWGRLGWRRWSIGRGSIRTGWRAAGRTRGAAVCWS